MSIYGLMSPAKHRQLTSLDALCKTFFIFLKLFQRENE
jgi:hypothetical protein